MLGILLLVMGTLYADDFTDLDGEKYTNATVKRVDPDGLVISYADGISKLKFKNLPADIQTKYGYDPQKEATLKSQLQAEAVARQTESRARAKEAEKKQILDNIISIKIVETDQRNYIGKIFYFKGDIEMDSSYNDGYLNAQDTHNSFQIIDGDFVKNTYGSAHAYMIKQKSEVLRKNIIEAGGKLKGIFKVTLLRDRFEDSPSLSLELIDFYPLDLSN